VTITVQGYNFQANKPIELFWKLEGQALAYQGTANGPSFNQVWTLYDVPNGVHQVRATQRQGNADVGVNFRVPCPNVTATPPAATATPTRVPADLVISGPVLISTPPIVEYQPLEFEFVISNVGERSVDTQFFTDAYIDPPATEVASGAIDLVYSDGYLASSALPAGATRVIVVRSPLGFTGGIQGTRTVYGMVDSVLQVEEGDETNNLTSALHVEDVTPAPSPTPSPTPGGPDSISGQIWAYVGSWAPQRRAQVWLVNTSTNEVRGPVHTAQDGRYAFSGVGAGTYNLYACIQVDRLVYAGSLPGITVPPGYPFADIFLIHEPLGCPY
jgi:hypothetical protein